MVTRALLFLCLLLPAWLRGEEVVFAAYNVQNFAPLIEPGRARPGKSEASANAVVEVLKEIRPDIIGLCEMGSEVQFAEFRRRLAEKGLHYPHWELVQAADPARRLALVSRLPIIARGSLSEEVFEAGGARLKISRGVLDVTVQGQGRAVRILGVHLKSKLPSREGEALVRRQEAHLVRRHVEAILAAEPQTPLLLFGDFNDTKDHAALQEISGRRGAPDALTPLALEDAHGDRWTHHWSVNDTYSRIDFLFVNRTLSPWVDRARSYLFRSPQWREASDHRPLVATLLIPE